MRTESGDGSVTREQEIQARLEALGTETWDDGAGPWECDPGDADNSPTVLDRRRDVVAFCDGGEPETAEFIAHARQDIPYLLSKLAEVEGERDAAVEMLRQVTVDWVPDEVFDGDPRCVCSAHRARTLLDSFKGSTPGAGEAGE